MRKNLKCFSLVILLCLILIVPLAACSSSPSPAPSPAAPAASSSPSTAPAKATTAAPAVTLRIGMMGGLTGPAVPAVTALMQEMQYLLKYINEVEGGIDGIKLDMKQVDNKGTPDGAVAAYKELRDGYKPQLYIGIEDYYMLGLLKTFAEDKSTLIATSALDARMYLPPGRVFGTAIATVDGFAAYSDWVLKDWKGTGKPKIGMLHIDLPSGLSWKPAENLVKSKGIDIVTAPFSMSALDVKPQLMSLRDAGANYIWIQANTQQAQVIVRDFRSLGLMGKIKPVFMEWTESDKVVELVGADVEGFYQYRTESPASDNSQSSKLWSQMWKYSTGKDRWCDNRLSMNIKGVITAAVKQAITDVGRDKIDGEALYNALNKLEKIDIGDGATFGYGPAKRLGVAMMKMSQYTKTGTVSASDWIAIPRIFEGVVK